jgi:hypothetical protein
VTRARAIFCALLVPTHLAAFAKLTPESVSAFDRYVELTEVRMKGDLHPERFLHVAATPEIRAKLRAGELRIERAPATKDQGKEIKVPGGLIHHWLGAMFIPNATIASVRAAMHDYEHYSTFYQPKVTESKQIAHQGEEDDIFLRVYMKQFLTVVLNSQYHVRYGQLDPQHAYVASRSTRIAEVKDLKHPDAGEEPVGIDSGFLWRLNWYWRLEQADSGVYAEWELISLSRDVPLAFRWMLKGFVEKMPKEFVMTTLRGTKAAVESH